MVGNVPADRVSAGESLANFVGSGPRVGTGLHRYVYLVYQQPGKLDLDEPRITYGSLANRGGFSVAKFATEYKLGNPVAGNFFEAKYDDYVPLLYQQLGLKP